MLGLRVATKTVGLTEGVGVGVGVGVADGDAPVLIDAVGVAELETVCDSVDDGEPDADGELLALGVRVGDAGGGVVLGD